MQGIERATARIAHIQATMASIAPPTAAPKTVSTPKTSFAAALNGAIASTAPTRTSTALNADGVPTSLAAYGNGKVPEHALSRVGNTTPLRRVGGGWRHR